MRIVRRVLVVLAVLFALHPSLRAHAQAPDRATLRGFVEDASTGTALPGANVVLRSLDESDAPPRGAVSGSNGLYQIENLPPGRYALQVTFVGYTPSRDTLQLEAGTVQTRTIVLDPATEQLGELVVEEEGGAATLEGGKQTVRAADIARIPTPDVSGDLVSYLQALPSVVSSGDRGGQLFIRGGTPSQNLVLVDGVPVYLPFHIVGFYSAFPEDLVANADVYAGGFGARYSSRISSVIDVSMRQGNKRSLDASGSLSPFLASARMEGPVTDDGTLSILGSTRHSIIESTESVYGEELPFRFSDTFVKLHGAPDDQSRYSLMGLHTYDRGRVDAGDLANDDVFRWSNVALGARLFTLPSESDRAVEVTGGLSFANNEVGSPERPERSSSIIRLGATFDFIDPEGRTTLNWGLFTRMHWMSRSIEEQFAGIQDESEVALGVGGYGELDVDLTETLTATPGTVLSWYDGIVPIPEPRLRLSWQPHENHTVTAASGVYWQPVAGLTDDRDAGSVFTVWTLDTGRTESQRAIHAMGGWQASLGPFQTTLEGYYKQLSDLRVPRFGTRASFSTEFTRATGTVYGFDARLEWPREHVYAYLGYGFAWTEYRADDEPLAVRAGEPITAYHPPHDRRHQVNAVLSADVQAYTASVRWSFGSGLPFTRFSGFDEFVPPQGLPDVRDQLGESRLFLSEPYAERLPVYHRLDVSLQRSFSLGAANLVAQLGAINAYDRRNLFYFDLFTAQRVDQLPVIPYLSLKLSSN
jgi:hypothetical protein